jgi:hypothetical protein
MKDRIALAMIEGPDRDGLLSPGDAVVEYTGGSTARRWLSSAGPGLPGADRDGRLLHRGGLPTAAGARRRGRRRPVRRGTAARHLAGHREHGRACRRARPAARARTAPWPPSWTSRKRTVCTGKGLGSAIRPLWGQRWARLPFFLQPREVLPQRGHDLRRQVGPGDVMVPSAPFWSLRTAWLSQKPKGAGIRGL